jgi:hypothetical protein
LADVYMHPPDLFVRDFDRTTIEAVLHDVVRAGKLPEHRLIT